MGVCVSGVGVGFGAGVGVSVSVGVGVDVGMAISGNILKTLNIRRLFLES